MQSGSFTKSMRVLFGSFGFQVKPMNTANVKSEFTFTIPSRAVMWMLVDILGILGDRTMESRSRLGFSGRVLD